jgi:hypothetical protein
MGVVIDKDYSMHTSAESTDEEAAPGGGVEVEWVRLLVCRSIF